jgi:predicted membrane-bound spermidine synthase
MFKRWLSYLIPVNIYKKKSDVSKSLEVSWNNGQLVLDSESANYSYGSLQRILKKGLKKIGFEKIVLMNDVLLLGVAGGSVIKTLVEEVNFKGNIVGVEIDAEIIKIANEYFKLDKIPNVEIIIDDANKFVCGTTRQFDLIIIDVFEDSNMPGFLFEQNFVDRLGAIVKEGGFILFNTMVLNKNQYVRNRKYFDFFDKSHFRAQEILKIEQKNELIIVEKVQSND